MQENKPTELLRQKEPSLEYDSLPDPPRSTYKKMRIALNGEGGIPWSLFEAVPSEPKRYGEFLPGSKVGDIYNLPGDSRNAVMVARAVRSEERA